MNFKKPRVFFLVISLLLIWLLFIFLAIIAGSIFLSELAKDSQLSLTQLNTLSGVVLFVLSSIYLIASYKLVARHLKEPSLKNTKSKLDLKETSAKPKKSGILGKLIVFIVFIGAVFVYYQFFHEETVSPQDDVFIPNEHLEKRFEYLEIKSFDVKWSPNKADVFITFFNSSYVYNLENIVFFIDFYDEIEGGKLVGSLQQKIESIPPRKEVLFEKSFDREENFISPHLVIEAVELKNP